MNDASNRHNGDSDQGVLVVPSVINDNMKHEKDLTTTSAVTAATTKTRATNDFVASMTFADPLARRLLNGSNAGGGGGSCDCDECGSNSYMTSVKSFIPAPIRLAIQDHKRRRKTHGPMARSQVRSLIRRWEEEQTLPTKPSKPTNDSDKIMNEATVLLQSPKQPALSPSSVTVALWQWTLPVSTTTEPLIEYGNSLVYRLIWVQRLPEMAVLKHVGKGIIGSQSEERGRIALDWQQGDVVLVPSRDGQAVGWTATSTLDSTSEDTVSSSSTVPTSSTETSDGSEGNALNTATGTPTTTSTPMGPVVLYIVKVTMDKNMADSMLNVYADVGDSSLDVENEPKNSILSILMRSVHAAAVAAGECQNGDDSTAVVAAASSTDAVAGFKLNQVDGQLLQQIVSKTTT